MINLALVAALVGTLGLTYGPGVHVREADLFVTQNPEWSDADLRRYVRLGAVFPDLRSGGVALPVNTHDKGLGDALKAVAELEGEPWKLAFAQGYRLHTASDTVAQVYYLPWLNAATDLQQVNLFGRESLGPVGDNELFVEGYGDLHSGSLQAFVDTAYDFLFEAPEDLAAVVELFLAALGTYAGDALDEAEARAAIDGFWSSVEVTLDGLDPSFVAMVIEGAQDLSVSEVIGLLSSGLFSDLLGSVPGTDGQLVADPHEMERLEAHLAGADPASFFAPYDDVFATMGLAILDDADYADWPWYRDAPIVTAIVQGFALGRPDLWAHHPEVQLWGASFSSIDGAPLTQLGVEDGPLLQAHSELYRVIPGPPLSVVFEVVAITPGGDEEVSVGTLLGSAEVAVAEGPERASATVLFSVDDAPSGTQAVALRWRMAGEPLPFLETDWARYAVYADAPLFRPSYRDGVAAYLPRLLLPEQTSALSTGWIRGHTVLPSGHRGVAAMVRAETGASTLGHPGGGFFLGALTPGEHVLSAEAVGYRGGPMPVAVNPGQMSVVRLDLRATPIVSVPAWSPRLDALDLEVDISHAPLPPEALEVSLHSTLGEVLGLWQGALTEGPLSIPYETLQSDGLALVARVSVDGGDVIQSEVVRLDSTPPAPPVMMRAGQGCSSPLSVSLVSHDTLAPVVGYEFSLDGMQWEALGEQGEVSVDLSLKAGEVVEAYGRALNASGLWSEVSQRTLCVVPGEAEDADTVVIASDGSSTEAAVEDVVGPERDASPPEQVLDSGVGRSEHELERVATREHAPSKGDEGGCRTGTGSLRWLWGLLGGLCLLAQRSRTRLDLREGAQGVIGGVFVGHGEGGVGQ